MAADGYVWSSAVCGSELVDLIDLHVLCLNGEGCSLSLSPSTMISEQLPRKTGAKAGSLPPFFTVDAPPNIAKARHCREDCESVLHLCSNRLICCLQIPSRLPNFGGEVCVGWLDTDRGLHICALSEEPSRKCKA